MQTKKIIKTEKRLLMNMTRKLFVVLTPKSNEILKFTSSTDIYRVIYLNIIRERYIIAVRNSLMVERNDEAFPFSLINEAALIVLRKLLE